MSDSPVRVRFAPSPTGALHIGGVRTALYNYLFARRHGGTFVLRIEDTDQTRFVPGAEQYIIESLRWLGISPDEGPDALGGEYGPYRQSERKDLYRGHAMRLIEEGNAYYAFDTPEELEAAREAARRAKIPAWQYNNITRSNMKNSLTLPEDEVKRRLESGDPYTIRIKMPRNEEVRVNDLVRGWVVVSTNEMDDKVIFKADGMPTYHLANIVDDHMMKITHVIRGEEWLPSAPLHVMLYKFLGWEATMPAFAHLSLILKPDPGSFINKRNRNDFADLFTKDFVRNAEKDEEVTEVPAAENVQKVMDELFSQFKNFQVALRAKDGEPGLKADIKKYVKSALYGKLSKRDGDRLGFPVFPMNWEDKKTGDLWQGYKENGWFPEAVVNLLAFLGWNPGTSQEIFSLDELVAAFSLERVGKAGSKFDHDKARWYNQHYLRARDGEALAKLLPEGSTTGDSNFVAAVCELMKERATFAQDILSEGSFFFAAPDAYDAGTVAKKWQDETPARMEALIDLLDGSDTWEAEALETRFKAWMEAEELGFGAVGPNFRVLVTGRGMGPSLFAVLELLGKEETLRRMRDGIPAVMKLKEAATA